MTDKWGYKENRRGVKRYKKIQIVFQMKELKTDCTKWLNRNKNQKNIGRKDINYVLF